MKKRIVFLIILLFIISNASAYEVSGVGTVTGITTYLDYGNGDVIFQTTNNGSGISGFWLDPQAEGFKQNLALLMLAKSTGASVRIYYDTVRWPGSGGYYYRVYCISML